MNELLKILKNPNDKLIAIDLDGVLCIGESWKEEELKPNMKMIKFVQELYFKGAHIIIWTARQPKYYSSTLAWLIKNEIPFHGIAQFVKCGADVYIDDKSLNLIDLECVD